MYASAHFFFPSFFPHGKRSLPGAVFEHPAAAAGGGATLSLLILHVHVLVLQAQIARFESLSESTCNSFSSWISPRCLLRTFRLRFLWTYHATPRMIPMRQRREKPHPRLLEIELGRILGVALVQIPGEVKIDPGKLPVPILSIVSHLRAKDVLVTLDIFLLRLRRCSCCTVSVSSRQSHT